MIVSKSLSRKLLASIWYCLWTLLLVLLLVQTIVGVYGDKYEEAWAWFLPTTMPTVLLVTGVIVAEAAGKKVADGPVHGFFFCVTAVLSIIYLLFVLATVLLAPFAAPDMSGLELMGMSHLWLGPIQGVVSGLMGAFFISSESASEGGVSDEQTSEDEKPEDEKPEGKKSEGKKSEGKKSEGKKSEGKKSEGDRRG